MMEFDETAARRLIDKAFPTEFPAGVPRADSKEDIERLRGLYRGAYQLFSQYSPKDVLCWISDALVNMTRCRPKLGDPVPAPLSRGVALFDEYVFTEGRDGAEILAVCAGAIVRMLLVMTIQERLDGGETFNP